MRVAIIENSAGTHHGQVGLTLHEAGALVDVHRPYAGDALPDPTAYDALVVFGGEQSARDDATHPYLPQLAALMAVSARAGLPTLGICLGAQVLARGMGAENRLGAAREFGWCDVALLPDAADDPVLAGLPATFPAPQWHSDTFTLPPGCTALATSPVAPVQCFRAGPRAWGMQFHFEASRPVMAAWSARWPEACERMHPGWAAALPGLAATRGAAADAVGLAIARAFVAVI